MTFKIICEGEDLRMKKSFETPEFNVDMFVSEEDILEGSTEVWQENGDQGRNDIFG